MKRVKAQLPMVISLIFAGLLCALLTPEVAAFAGNLPEVFSRIIGVALLGLAVLAIVAVFRSLPVPAMPATRPLALRRESEFRRGFSKGRNAAYRPRIEPRLDGPAQVVALHRPAAPAPQATPVQTTRTTPPDSIESVKRRLQDRAEALWRRRAS